MFGTRWMLVTILGIPIRVDASWFFILALVVWSLGGHFSQEAPGMSAGAYWLMGLIAALAFFTCLVLHELGHAVVARSLGTPIRGITLFLFGGVAEMQREPASGRDEFLIAIAGPLVSAALGVGFLLLGLVGFPPLVTVVLVNLGVINLALLVFNMMPAFPLDGGRVFRAVLWALTGDLRRATWLASGVGQGLAFALIGLGLLLVLSGHAAHGVWAVLIGLFVSGAARSAYQDVVAKHLLAGEPLERVRTAPVVVVPPTLSLARFVEDVVYRFRHSSFPVCEDGRLVGVVSPDAVTHVPREEWDRRAVGDVMLPPVAEACVPPGGDALEALRRIQQTGSPRLYIVEEGRLVGLVCLEDLSRFMELKSALGDVAESDIPLAEIVETSGGKCPHVPWQEKAPARP